MQILADAFSARYSSVFFYARMDRACLEGVRLYRSGQVPDGRYVYLADSQNPEIFDVMEEGQSWAIIGPEGFSGNPKKCTAIVIQEEVELLEILEFTQNLFEKYEKWDRQIHEAFSMEYPLTEMLRASIPIFQNPIFVHDANSYILAWSHRAPGMLVWDKDQRTGWNMVPLELIHDFKVDAEYQGTLVTREPCLFSAEQRGYPILYKNLWNGNHYEGRICVDELETPILRGQYLAIGYLADLIVSYIKNSSLFRLSKRTDLAKFFQGYLDGSVQDQGQVLSYLNFLNWNRFDRYLYLRLESKGQDIRMLSSASVLGHIEAQIPDGHTLIYQRGLTVIVNLSYSHTRVSDVVSRLSPFLREGLLEMGVSSEIYDFFQLRQGHLQAGAALELGHGGPSTSWCHHFEDYILEFLLKKGQESLLPELLCSNKLLLLKQYDEKNKTEFYFTLKVYLEKERNVLQTAKELFIHRSTLFYRLDRIRKIADVNLEDAKERLVLQISYYLLEEAF